MFTDDIIKEQKKLKKKTQKLKTQQTQKKVAQKQQGKQQTKGAAANQKQRKRTGGKQNGQSVQQRQGTQGRRRPIAGKQRAPQKQATQGQRRAIGVKSQGRSGRGNQSIKRNTISRDKGRFVGAKVTANRLKNKLGSLQRVGLFSFFTKCLALEIRIINSSPTLVIKVLLDIHYHLLVNIHITNNLSRVNDKVNNLNPGISLSVPSENYWSFNNHSNSNLLHTCRC